MYARVFGFVDTVFLRHRKTETLTPPRKPSLPSRGVPQTIFDSFYISTYNAVFTLVPIAIHGLGDQGPPARP